MWSKLRKQVAVECQQMQELFNVHRPLLEKCVAAEPDPIELSALGAMLHAFYTGGENIFKRVMIELGEDLPSGEAWHRRLLNAMARAGRDRPAAVSESLRDALRPYLEFRHVFRQAYTFQLKWPRMARLVVESESIFKQLQMELDAFLEAGKARG